MSRKPLQSPDLGRIHAGNAGIKRGRTCMLMVYATSGTFGDGFSIVLPNIHPINIFFQQTIYPVRFLQAVQPPKAPSVRARIPHGVHERGVPRDKKNDESRGNMGGHGLAPKNQKLTTINVLYMSIRVLLYYTICHSIRHSIHKYIYNIHNIYTHMSPHIWMHTYDRIVQVVPTLNVFSLLLMDFQLITSQTARLLSV